MFRLSCCVQACCTKLVKNTPKRLLPCLLKVILFVLILLLNLLKLIAMFSFQSNFIAEFSRLKSLSLQKWKAGEKALIGLWMELLANVAFYRDGQQMIVKIEHFIPLLLEFCASKSKKVHEAAMLLLRNMCFHVPSKTLLLSNSELQNLVMVNST